MDAADIHGNVCVDAGGIGAVLDCVEYIRHWPDVLHQTVKEIIYWAPGVGSLMLSHCTPDPVKTPVFVGGCSPRDPGNMHYAPFVIASHRRWRGNPVIYALAQRHDI